MCGCVGYGVHLVTSDNKIHELPLSTSEFKHTERMLFESSPDPICLYVSTHDSVFISSNVQPVSSLHLSQVELSKKINNKMTLLFPTKAVLGTSTSNNNDLIGLFENYSSDVFHYYNIKLFLTKKKYLFFND